MQIDDPRIGTVLQGRYRILEALAAGGMGAVYRGERLGIQRIVAIKFLHDEFAARPEIRKRFEIEARAMSRLSHPHCVSVMDFGLDGVPYLVMDYVTGRSLGKLIEQGPVPIKRALHITRQLLAGLGHAHSQGIVHRDIKPDNLILDEALGTRDHLRILDFGLAKLHDFGVDLTSGFAIGTPSYMAPEQTLAQPVDTRTDLYAVGIVLSEMLTGTKPFRADSIAELLRLQREGTPVPIRIVHPEAAFSEELESVVLRALAKQPAARFQTAIEMAAALEAIPEASRTATDAARRAPLTEVVPGPSGPEPFDATASASPIEAVSVSRQASPPAVQIRDDATVTETPAARRGSDGRRRWLLVGGIGFATASVLVVAFLAARDSIRSGAQSSAELVAPAATRAAPPAPPARDPMHDDLRAQIDSSRSATREIGLKTVARLRKQDPRDAELAYLEGNAHADKMWWSEALSSYRDAIRLDSRYREDPRLINDMIGSLMSSSFHDKGVRFLREEIGAPAVPLLEQASQNAASTMTRKRAATLLRTMRS